MGCVAAGGHPGRRRRRTASSFITQQNARGRILTSVSSQKWAEFLSSPRLGVRFGNGLSSHCLEGMLSDYPQTFKFAHG